MAEEQVAVGGAHSGHEQGEGEDELIEYCGVVRVFWVWGGVSRRCGRIGRCVVEGDFSKLSAGGVVLVSQVRVYPLAPHFSNTLKST